MLVLKMKAADEGVHIGDNVIIKVLSVEGEHVMVGFSAPRHVQIDTETRRAAKVAEGLHPSKKKV